MKIILLTIFFLLTWGCSKKHEAEPKYTLEEFIHLLDASGATADKKVTNINFSDYDTGVGRTTSRALEYQHLGFYALEFETVEQARQEAIRLNQYYSRNWLFDKTEGEPILEDYVIANFKAINPNRRIQKKPKEKKAEAHGEAHH